MGTAEIAQRDEDSLVGAVVQDRFRVLERVAAGGMGVVYRAEQVPLGRPVALKVLEQRSGLQQDGQFSERFFLEAATVAKLSHPNTIVLYDYGRTEEGFFFYAMEFVAGRTLSRTLHEDGPLESQRAIHVGMQICGSLREAHEAGTVHRDLKPGNVMLTRRGSDSYFVKVLDFGLVKVVGQEQSIELTKSGMLMGSPRYMAPEQVRGIAVDHRADIYSFGALLFHMLAGAPPFRGESQFEVMRAHVADLPPSLKSVYPFCDASPRLEALVMRCLEKDPDLRFESMDALITELHQCALELDDGRQVSSACLPMGPVSVGVETAAPATGDAPSAPTPTPTPTPLPSGEAMASAAPPIAASTPPRSKPWALLVVGLLAALGVGGGVALGLLSGREQAPIAPEVAEAAPAPVAEEVEPAPHEPAPEPEPGPVAALAPVRLVSVPEGARVQRGEEDLGDAPLGLALAPGESWRVTLSLPGHEPRTIVVRSGQETLTVHLAPEPTRSARGDRRPPRRERASDEAEAAEPAAVRPERAPRDESWRRSSDNRDPWEQ